MARCEHGWGAGQGECLRCELERLREENARLRGEREQYREFVALAISAYNALSKSPPWPRLCAKIRRFMADGSNTHKPKEDGRDDP